MHPIKVSLSNAGMLDTKVKRYRKGRSRRTTICSDMKRSVCSETFMCKMKVLCINKYESLHHINIKDTILKANVPGIVYDIAKDIMTECNHDHIDYQHILIDNISQNAIVSTLEHVIKHHL